MRKVFTVCLMVDGIGMATKTKIKTIHSLSKKEKAYNKKLSNKIIRREVELGIGYDE